MTGVPSIVMGLFIFTIWVIPRGVDGVNGFAGALALGCLMLPIIIRSTEEMLQAGARPPAGGQRRPRRAARPARSAGWCCRPPFPGILSGVLLAVARAAGETAPLLFTIGAATSVNWNPFKGPNTALSIQIFSQRSAALRRAPRNVPGVRRSRSSS